MLEFKLIDSILGLRQISEEWNKLWELSDSVSPLTRNESLAIWLEHFANDRSIRTVTLWEGTQLVAALPLLIGKRKGLKVAELPNNEWSSAGDLLIVEERQSRLFEALLQAINQVETLAVWLDLIRIDQPKWQQLIKHLRSHSQSAFARPRFEVSDLATPKSLEAYQQTLSKNHRKKLRRSNRNLESLGALEMTSYNSDCLANHLQEAFAIEHSGWKGEAGTSIVSLPQIESFFRSLASNLDSENFLELDFLRLEGKAIVFDLGYLAKGVRGSHKVSFDVEFAKSSPGHVLIEKQIERAGELGIQSFDTVGPVSEALQKWTQKTYTVGRLFFSNQRWTSRVTVGAMGQISRILSKLKLPVGSK